MKRTDRNEPSRDEGQGGMGNEMTIGDLLSAISETEYPEYILDALSQVQGWMTDTVNAPAEKGMDNFTALFEGGGEEEEENGIENLFARLEGLEKYADLIPNSHRPEGHEDLVVISVMATDYESGLRTAIDYAAIFNRPQCRRVWIISDAFAFDDVARYAAHVDALTEQGVSMRFILVTPWGWVELPLSGAMAAKRQFTWRTPLNPQRGHSSKNGV